MMISPKPSIVKPADRVRDGSLGKRSCEREEGERRTISSKNRTEGSGKKKKRIRTLMGASRPVATETICGEETRKVSREGRSREK